MFLQYLVGFQRLGYDVLFVDRLSPEMLGGDRGPVDRDHPMARWLHGVMDAQGLSERYALLLDDGTGDSIGLSRDDVAEMLRRSTILLDVMGFLEDEELLACAPRRVFLDIDPGFPQMWHELGLSEQLGRHDAYLTVGLRLGKDACAVPACGIDWITTTPPVVLDQWPVRDGGKAYTSVASWRGPFEPIDFGGQRFGLRAHQMRSLAGLPSAVDVPLELALDIDDADHVDSALLREGGWRLVPPGVVAGDADAYRSYIQHSRGEVACAKDLYVRSRGGWVSDRSICYLASGKPVLTQATGFELEIETGEGLLSFESFDEALSGLEQIEGEYDRHCAAARALAVERFSSDKVLDDLLQAIA